MPTIHIDGAPYEVAEGLNLLDACLSLGLDVPHFCWHPALGSVGACRQCAIKQFKDENDTHGRIVMACMTAAEDGVRISIDDPDAVEFRRTIVEWLMLNHPHDCPVCDEGGECHLQDMTVMTGHDYRETRFAKRTHHDQDLGPFVQHEMNRCIQCYRCLRFYRDYAGGRDFSVFAAHDHVYFGRAESGRLESEFSGNLVEICPTGVFTDKTFRRHFTRKWDLTTAPSVCPHCSLGCNTILGSRYGTVRRVRNRYHPDVNGYFLCDRGRFGYEYANDVQRLTTALVDGEPTSPDVAVDRVRSLLTQARGVVGIASPRASLETLLAVRQLVGSDRFCPGMPAAVLASVRAVASPLISGAASAASLGYVRGADAVLLLGGDVTDSAPMLSLALRQSVRVAAMAAPRALHVSDWDDSAVREAIQTEFGPLFIASITPTRLDDIATESTVAAPTDVARLGLGIAQELGAEIEVHLHADARAFARRAAAALAAAKRPVVVVDALAGEDVAAAAAAAAAALASSVRGARLSLAAGECNAVGAALMGGMSLEDALEVLRSGAADALVVAETDLFHVLPRAIAEEMLELPRTVIALDSLRTATVDRAGVVLPSASFAEATGTLVSAEGRAQRFFACMPATGDARESWKWLATVAAQTGDFGRETSAADSAEWPAWRTADDACSALAGLPAFARLGEAAPPATFRILSMKVPRQPHRYSGRTSMHADIDVKEQQPAQDADSPLAYTMEGYPGAPPPPLTPRYWAGGWNSVQAVYRYQTLANGALLGGSPGVRLLDPAAERAPAPANGAEGQSPAAATAAVATAAVATAAAVARHSRAPDAFEPREAEWLLVGVQHIFGSEELSAYAPGIAALSPKPYVGLSPGDADRAGLTAGDRARVETPEGSLELGVRVVSGLASGIATVPVGLRDMPGTARPGLWARIGPAASRGPDR